jgi:C-terminal processing protease CtpA/Prc
MEDYHVVTVPTGRETLDLAPFVLHPTPTSITRTGNGLTGLTPGSRNGQPIVRATRAGYPAEKAGLRSGDAILSVNGKDARGTSGSVVQVWIVGDVENPVELVVASPGTAPRNVTFRRIPRPAAAIVAR